MRKTVCGGWLVLIVVTLAACTSHFQDQQPEFENSRIEQHDGLDDVRESRFKDMSNVQIDQSENVIFADDHETAADERTFDINVNSYDPDYGRIIEKRLEALPVVNQAAVLVFNYQIIAGVDLSGREQASLPVIQDTILGMANGKDLYISSDPAVFTRIENIKRGYPLLLQNDLHDLLLRIQR